MLHFGWFVGHGFGVQGWGAPGYGIGYDWKKPALYQHAVREFERAGLDLFIIEDSLTVPDTYGGSAKVSLAQASFAPKHDPLALVPYLLSATEHLGIVPTVSASFYPPFTAARLLATLQHFSNGQLGWNVVTSGSDLAAQNYGLDQQIEHDLRYEKAEEFVDVVRRLWRSWEPDAILEDAEAGVFADHTKVHPINHDGEFFKVRGPLNTAPLPEEPVLVQAGASPRGKAFAGGNADVAIALARGVDGMKAYRDSIRAEAAAAGRNADDVKVLYVLKPTVVGSRAEAEELREQRRQLTQRDIDSQLNSISYLSVIDFKQFDLDAPLPELTTNSNQGTLDHFAKAGPPGSTLRQLLQARSGGAGDSIIGTAEEIADYLEETGAQVGGDGFLFSGFVDPATVHGVLDRLAPVLRRRGLLRTSYGDGGFRRNLRDF
ncbi:NtaA/DmoA family FMN-dependent monooxygenase [Arthrobacter sp. ISL-69]|uniref:NtaA/DmoA family FMN-dependent monooxygenase n=1 Tax=Arthrobacter sp. ISL-69 TaxID=2819113 RepID=UPI001BE81576|nr:NtaA/DmoA family FMN-dependent monooxygenase [Arthrobacter sp. ISL-69]MBT2535063.1 NtaA/DmoA family FMN-dependent monooxygenase [Arthrobacter sp. ISL-69]